MYSRLPGPTAMVQVVPFDSLDVADGLRADGVPESDIVVLNMANEHTPGGWYPPAPVRRKKPFADELRYTSRSGRNMDSILFNNPAQSFRQTY
jgi:hypothetical protein